MMQILTKRIALFAACESIRAKKVFPIIDFFLLTNKLPAQPNMRAVQNEVSLYFYFY